MRLANQLMWTTTGFVITHNEVVISVDVIQHNVVKVVSQPCGVKCNTLQTARCQVNEQYCKWTICHIDNCIGLKTGELSVVWDGNCLKYYNENQLVLSEFAKKQTHVKRTIGVDDDVPIPPKESSSLNIDAHYFRQVEQGYHAKLKLNSDPHEYICGLGGYQEPFLNKNGGQYELQQRNSQTSMPMYISNKNYCFIWNNASIGQVTFSKNHYLWEAYLTQSIEYIVCVGDNIKELMRTCGQLIGYAPKMPKCYLGLWQSKLRYQTLNELKEVYNQYVSRQIYPSVLVIDYFHWMSEGSFEFDTRYWQGILEFCQMCRKTQTHVMVSVWPTVSTDCPYWQYYCDNNMLIRHKNNKTAILFNQAAILDFSNTKTQEVVKNMLIHNYINSGITLFWADQAEPEMTDYQHQQLYVEKGNLLKVGNQFPLWYLQAIPNQTKDNTYLPTLIRSVWLGAQQYGALAWSGDINSSFEAMSHQIQIAKSMGICGQAWWTSDTGGFHAYTSDKEYNIELMIRWFQFSTFSPILRMHGDRQPHYKPIGKDGGGKKTSGFDNEIWSFGETAEKIMTDYIRLRERLIPYITTLFEECHEKGYPLIRPLFFEYPQDKQTWQDNIAYFFGSDLLVCPVVTYQARHVQVYLPKGEIWIHLFTKKAYVGGQVYNVPAPLNQIPVFVKKASSLHQQIDDLFM